MSNRPQAGIPANRAPALYLPQPSVLYTLEAAAHLAGISRRSLLILCRAGLIRPVLQPPYGVMAFTEEAIFIARRIEFARTVHGLGPAWIRSMVELMEEVDRLRQEVRFLRSR